MSGYALAAVALLAAGCTSPVRLVRPGSCQGQSLQLLESPELLMPRLEHPFVPPMPVPATTHGHRMIVRVVVDTTGRVMRDSVIVCGIGDPMYSQRIAEEVSQIRFRPALMRAKHLVAPTLFVYDF